jgi:hypothetical protein
MKRKLLTKTPVCPRERLVIISYTTGLSFALERIGPLAAIVTSVFYLLILYLFALPNTPENQFASIYSESLIKTTCQHLLLLVGFDTLIYRKYYDTPPLYLWVIIILLVVSYECQLHDTSPFMGLVEYIVYLATNCGVAGVTQTQTPVGKPLHQGA